MTWHYVYILESLSAKDAHYVGLTQNLKERLAKHNRGEIAHTSKQAQ